VHARTKNRAEQKRKRSARARSSGHEGKEEQKRKRIARKRRREGGRVNEQLWKAGVAEEDEGEG